MSSTWAQLLQENLPSTSTPGKSLRQLLRTKVCAAPFPSASPSSWRHHACLERVVYTPPPEIWTLLGIDFLPLCLMGSVKWAFSCFWSAQSLRSPTAMCEAHTLCPPCTQRAASPLRLLVGSGCGHHCCDSAFILADSALGAALVC